MTSSKNWLKVVLLVVVISLQQSNASINVDKILREAGNVLVKGNYVGERDEFQTLKLSKSWKNWLCLWTMNGKILLTYTSSMKFPYSDIGLSGYAVTCKTCLITIPLFVSPVY